MWRLRSIRLMRRLRSIPTRTILLVVLSGLMAVLLWTQSQTSSTQITSKLQAETTIRTSSIPKPGTSQLKSIAVQQNLDTGAALQALSNVLHQTPVGPLIKPNNQVRSNAPRRPDTKIPARQVTSILHPDTPELPELNRNVAFDIRSMRNIFDEYQELFPQHGKNEPGIHYRIENTELLKQPNIREKASVLVICVFNNVKSWGENRSITDFFNLIGTFNYPKEHISVALLTSSIQEFDKVKKLFQRYKSEYPRLSVIFRNDFVQNGLTRGNRHEVKRQADRRRMLARYRNYALLVTMETWHQHVLWIDADVKIIPPHLLRKMTLSGLDILTPICFSNFRGKWINYDQNAWVGQRLVRQPELNGDDFMPGPLDVKLLDKIVDKSKPYTPLDSVGATMLYVRADVHRQGVLFPMHYVIGSEWGREGFDGIETEGLCYTAHFLGFKCWGMVNESIQHTDEI